MPIRITDYSLKLIERENEHIGEYPLVYPIVLYTGTSKWNVERTITEKQKEYYNIPKQNYPTYNLIDVNKYVKEELIEDTSIISKAMLFEKLKNKREIEEILKKLLKRKMSKKEIEYITIMLTYSNFINKQMDQEEIEKYKKLISEGGTTMVTNFERLFVELVNEKHEIRKKAEAEGRAEGLKITSSIQYNLDKLEVAFFISFLQILKLAKKIRPPWQKRMAIYILST